MTHITKCQLRLLYVNLMLVGHTLQN
ncbi:hypothetical protein KTH84_03765 [Acinetobacter sp. WU_MDCI_Abxb74]|nr:hypothetical protein [Acinetobacter sp. WU_MDCI_Abxb74]